jgi:hypothetical protein
MYNNDTERLFAEGGMNDEGGTVDPVSGNDVPAGSLKNEVRDDIPAQLSEGEFVVPADVVRYIGLERLMKLRDEAKAGLARMNEIGQMGNAQEVENPEALHNSEDDGFDSEIDDIMQEVESQQPEVKKFEAGGFAVPGTDFLSKYNIPKTSITNPALDVRAYKNAQGRVMYITFFNDKPSIAIPAGYEFAGSAGQFIAETKKVDETKPVVTATETVESGGDGPTGLDGGATVGGSGIGTGTGIGNSAIGIAIGAIANAIDGLTNTAATPVGVTDAVTTTGVSTSASAEGLAESAAAISVDDASISEGVSEGTSTNGLGSTAATAAADNSGNTSGDSEGGSSDGSAGGSVGGDGTGPGSYAKGGLVAKRTKKPTLAQKRGIASKK